MAAVDHPFNPLTGSMFNSLIVEIQGCGVPFEVYDKNQYESSLNGSDREKLQELPSKLKICQPPEYAHKVKNYRKYVCTYVTT